VRIPYTDYPHSTIYPEFGKPNFFRTRELGSPALFQAGNHDYLKFISTDRELMKNMLAKALSGSWPPVNTPAPPVKYLLYIRMLSSGRAACPSMGAGCAAFDGHTQRLD